MSEPIDASGIEDKPQPYTFEEVSKAFTNYLEQERPGLKRFYRWEEKTEDEFDQYLRDPVTRGLAMTRQLMDHGCPRGVAMELSLLALYDLVVLIDNSRSMGAADNGSSAETLRDILKAASTVYSFAHKEGITAVRFLNTSNTYFNVVPGKIRALMHRIVFAGLAIIGTKLQDRVLVNHVTPDMARPLLVIVVIGEIEGEVQGLWDAIADQALALKEQYGDHGPQAVAYQFAKIGNHRATKDLVECLAGDNILGPYIHYMAGDEHRLGNLMEDMWRILPKLLLGAISDYWDKEADTYVTLQNRDERLAPLSHDDGGDGGERDPKEDDSSEDE